MHVFVVVIVSCALIPQCNAQTCGREMLSYNFNDRPGPFTNWTKADVWKVWPPGVVRKDFRGDEQIPGVIYTKGLNRASVGLGQLRLLMPKDCIGTNECGARFAVRLDEEVEEATLSYRFKFGEEYGKGEVRPGQNMRGEVYGLIDNWTLGGKLPGLADEDAATACSNSKDVTGTGSFVARTMWRQGGKLMSYMYVTPTKDECVNGENWWYDKSIEAGVWYTMYMYIKLNTPDKRDGKHQVWVASANGEAELVYNKTDVYYRSIPGHGIAKLKFDSFHGGSDSRYSPSTDRYVYFDDLKIRQGLCIDPGLDLFTQEASQAPVLQLSDSFTGSYSRDFGAQSVIKHVAPSGPGDPAAKQNVVCVPASGKDHQVPWQQQTATDGDDLPCGDSSASMLGAETSESVPRAETNGASGRIAMSQWHAVLHLLFVAACTSVTLCVL